MIQIQTLIDEKRTKVPEEEAQRASAELQKEQQRLKRKAECQRQATVEEDIVKWPPEMNIRGSNV